MKTSDKWDLIKISLIVFLTPLFTKFLGNNLGGLIALIFPLSIIFFLPLKAIKKNTHELGFKKPKKVILLITKSIILGLVLSFIFKTLLEPLLEISLREKRNLSSFYELKGNSNLLLVYIVRLILIAGFYEEIVFRGFLFNSLNRLFRFKYALGVSIIISSVIFSLFHGYQGLVGIFYTFFAGVAFCLAYLYFRKNLWSVILIHAVFDISSAFLIYFDEYDSLNSLFFSF